MVAELIATMEIACVSPRQPLSGPQRCTGPGPARARSGLARYQHDNASRGLLR
jgi:hypothetical protein